jgi:hypothetical protein
MDSASSTVQNFAGWSLPPHPALLASAPTTSQHHAPRMQRA